MDALTEVSMQEKEELTASAQVGQRKFTVLQGRECVTIQTGFICLDLPCALMPCSKKPIMQRRQSPGID